MCVARNFAALVLLQAFVVAAAAWAEGDLRKQTTPRGPSAGTDQVKRLNENLDRSKREAERLKEIEMQRELERQQILDYLDGKGDPPKSQPH
jgi:hypothetical protein